MYRVGKPSNRCGTVIRGDLIRIQLADASERVLLADRVLHVTRFPLAPARIDVGRVAQEFRLGPFQEVLRGARADIPAFAEVAMVLAILAPFGIPERDILRIERSLRDDRFGRIKTQ